MHVFMSVVTPAVGFSDLTQLVLFQVYQFRNKKIIIDPVISP